MEKLKKDRTFVLTTSSALSSPAGCFPFSGAHKMSEMYGPGDPTKISASLSKADVVLKAKQIARRTCRITGSGACLLAPPTPNSGSKKLCNPGEIPVHEHATPLQAEVGQESDKLGRKQEQGPAIMPVQAGPSCQTSPDGSPRGKQVGTRRYKGKTMPVSSGPALSLSKGSAGSKPVSSEGTARPRPPRVQARGSLGSFLDATIARSRQIENTETPNENAATPVNSPESVEYSSDDLDEDYVELDNDFIEKCKATTDARKIKKLLAEHAVRYTPSPDPKFATSPINIRDKDYDFSLDLSHIAIVEKTPFCGTEKESAVEHMTELSTLSGLFSDDIKMRTYFVAKFFPFSLKDDAKTWYNNLPPGSIKSPKELLDVFFRKYFPASAQHAALQRIYNFDQEDGEKLPEAWARFCSLIRAQPDHDLEKHDLLDIFYSGLTIESRAYLDSCAGCVFRKRTPDAEELLAKIGRNHDDWSTPEPTPTPIVKKRGMIKLNDEDMREAKKSLKEKGIKPEDVKNLPPIEDICETIPPSSMIEDPLYPEGHPKRVEQDSQLIKTSAPSKKKKKKHKNVVESSEPVNDPNSISISDAETESGNEHEEDNDKNDTPDKEEIEKEPEKPAKNKKYTKEDFITEKHGAVIDCNKGMVTFNVDDKEHTVYFPKRIDKILSLFFALSLVDFK
ncbi:hypothetical protein QYE76_054971 [Lolium multiflorum]|uniref:Retrotransposon gag domain-containing protein n=1 Tax=Lolium multiflorum TaxID=4521 RepID=A0AAD8SZJ5_LOLMU|nr:hypothetical protein QYE76_054971 [Lolium multiflorum]